MAWEWQIESGWFDFAVQPVWNAKGQPRSQTEYLWYKLWRKGECTPLNLHIAGIKCNWPSGSTWCEVCGDSAEQDDSVGDFNQLVVPWQSTDVRKHINLGF